MDSLITASAHSLALGDPLLALKTIALRNDAPALALRGVAMAQLGDFGRAKMLLRRAARAFGRREPVSRARCVVAEAEIALVSRDLSWPAKALDEARSLLERRGDRFNAAHAGCLAARRLLLVGRVEEAGRVLAEIDPAPLSPAGRASYELAVAGVALRRLHTGAAAAAIRRAAQAARTSRIAALEAEVEGVALLLTQPAATVIAGEGTRSLVLAEVEELLGSGALVLDACRGGVTCAGATMSLATRPVLFTLARALAEAWPRHVSRDALVRRAFRAKRADESHRARLRVEIGRLRAELGAMAQVNATEDGYALSPARANDVVVLAPPFEERHTDVLALLADGECWSSSALAIALGVSPRTVQRALEQLHGAGRAQCVGQGRARRWMTPPAPGFPTSLLLPPPVRTG